MLREKVATGCLVVYEARRIWSHLLLSGNSSRTVSLDAARGPDRPNLIHGATMQPCRIDHQASGDHVAAVIQARGN